MKKVVVVFLVVLSRSVIAMESVGKLDPKKPGAQSFIEWLKSQRSLEKNQEQRASVVQKMFAGAFDKDPFVFQTICSTLRIAWSVSEPITSSAGSFSKRIAFEDGVQLNYILSPVDDAKQQESGIIFDVCPLLGN